jgi:hypothetical protein
MRTREGCISELIDAIEYMHAFVHVCVSVHVTYDVSCVCMLRHKHTHTHVHVQGDASSRGSAHGLGLVCGTLQPHHCCGTTYA